MDASAAIDGTGRYNMYEVIHKAMRLFMTQTLAEVGAMDCSDAGHVAAVLKQVRELAGGCRSHFLHENAFVHPAMEARRPGSSAQVAGEHEHHAQAIGCLEELAQAVESAPPAARQAAADALYRYLALFTAENFVHMNLEETAHNEVLWAEYTDAELAAIEQAIVASLAPEELAMTMRWLMLGMNASQRAAKLQEVREHAPAPVFDGMLAMAKAHLPAADWRKLMQALALPVPAAA